MEIETKFDIGDMVFIKKDVHDLNKEPLQIISINATGYLTLGAFGAFKNTSVEYSLAISGNLYIGFDLIQKREDDLISNEDGIGIRKAMVNGGDE